MANNLLDAITSPLTGEYRKKKPLSVKAADTALSMTPVGTALEVGEELSSDEPSWLNIGLAVAPDVLGLGPVADPLMKAIKGTKFKTAKGSTYEVQDGNTTVRDKAARPEHPGESGVQPQSVKTIYMPRSELEKFAGVHLNPDMPTEFIPTGADTAALRLTEDWGPRKAGEILQGTEVKFTLEPEVGLNPVEILDFKNPKGIHFGNEIIEVESNIPKVSKKYAEGGVAMDEQMDAVFKSSRTEVDPVSGNEVPPGSLPEEVRDDIPAQLSEGEYVVPADVLRFYGMKFFEDLRKEAKVELARMDAEGRIGGEPMGEMQEGDLTPEEMAEIETMMMAVGGFATQQDTQSTQTDPYQQQQMMYRQGAPVAMGNAGYNQGGDVRGYNFGGTAASMLASPTTQAVTPPTTPAPMGTQANIDFSQFGAGFSFSPQAQQNLQQISQQETSQFDFTPVLMYSPEGIEVEATTLEEYNNYLSMGYTMAPPAVKPSNDDGSKPPPTDTETKDPTSWADDLDFTDPEALTKDVYAMIEMSKGEKAGMTAAMSGLGLVGAAGAGAYRATGIARANAVANIIEAMYGEKAAKDIRTKINETIEDSIFLKNLPDEWIDGDQITSDLTDKLSSTILPAAMSRSKDFYQSLTGLGGGKTKDFDTSSKAIQDEQTVMSQQVKPKDDDDPVFAGDMEEQIEQEVEDYAASGKTFDMNDPSTWAD